MSLGFVEVHIPESVIKKYLENQINRKIKIKKYERLGTGWHGTGYKIVYNDGKKDTTVILRTLRPEGFSHDYAADRAKTFLLQHRLSKLLPEHIKSFDVGGFTKSKLVSLGDCEEFFQIVEFAEGQSYVDDLLRIKEKGLSEEDKRTSYDLSDYLVWVHEEKFSENLNEDDKKAIMKSIYRRHTRDVVGDGEMIMGVLDTYPENLKWTNRDEFVDIINKAVKFREGIKDLSHRLTRIHGDFHPGNIIFENNNFKVLDASRELWGEPADDLTCLTVNYIWYAVQQTGKFDGIFKELFDICWNNYMEKTKDNELNKVAPLFFAFRSIVVAHPLFFPNQTDETRRKMFNFAKNILDEKEFNVNKINKYLK